MVFNTQYCNKVWNFMKHVMVGVFTGDLMKYYEIKKNDPLFYICPCI